MARIGGKPGLGGGDQVDIRRQHRVELGLEHRGIANGSGEEGRPGRRWHLVLAQQLIHEITVPLRDRGLSLRHRRLVAGQAREHQVDAEAARTDRGANLAQRARNVLGVVARHPQHRETAG